jgi:Mg2+/Co2+ transporter CorB
MLRLHYPGHVERALVAVVRVGVSHGSGFVGIERAADGSAVVSGPAPIREVKRALDLALPDDGSWTTIAGLCLAVRGVMPNTGEVTRCTG